MTDLHDDDLDASDALRDDYEEPVSAPAAEPAHADLAAGEVLALAQGKLDDDKAEDVVCIDLQGKSPLADYVLVASGRSQRHVAAMADHLLRAFKDAGLGSRPVEGLPGADWVLIDAGDVIVHLFRPEVRAFYQIEKIWSVDSPHQMARPSAFGG
ncbi:MAG: ribosome silencing factor [Caulobacteraceae bacterium]|nr:ribosome silencing factor [Caulobacter sp.]